MADNKQSIKTIAENRKARHDYFVIETYEAGVELFGTEVKSLRRGGVNLKDSYCEIDRGELFALGVHILKKMTTKKRAINFCLRLPTVNHFHF